MFRVRSNESGKAYRLAVVGLLLLSAAALAVTIWFMVDFLREQEIVEELIRKLPDEAKKSAEVLAGELRWQFRLTILVVLNVVVTGIAVVLLSRAHRSSQESLRDIKVLAGDILSSMDQGVITTDMNDVVTSINQRGLDLLTPSSDPVGRSLSELSPSIRLDRFRDEWMDQKSVALTRDFTTTTDGRDRILRAFCQTLSDIDNNEIGYVLQLRDVTDRVLIEDRVRRMERYMGLGSLAAGLHHEIKNPLAALSLHVQLLQEQLGQNAPEEAAQMLGVVQSEVGRIGEVLEGFRDFASNDRLNIDSVNLRELIKQQVELVRPRAVQQDVAVEIQLPGNEIPEVIADRVRLEQVLLNLLVNALDAMPRGGRLRVQAHVLPEAISIKVADTGTGIPKELQDKVFDAYFTTKGTGTGLGLALCDKIMRQHDGSLHFQSSETGTTFEMTLPLNGQDHG